MVSDHERLVRRTAGKLNPSLPLEYRPLPNGSSHPVVAWTDYTKAVVKIDESWKPGGSFLARKGERSGLEAVCRDIPAHEVAGHNNSEYTRGCPGSVDVHALMKHQVSNALLFATQTKESGQHGGGQLDALRRWILEHPPSNNG